MGLDVSVTREEAAQFFRCSASVIKGWVERYRVPAIGVRPKHGNVYRLGDLVEAEHRARSAGRGRTRHSQR
jgi:hypothetical protein